MTLAYRSPGKLLLKLLQGPALGFRYLAPEIAQSDQGEGTEQEKHPIPPIAFLIERKEIVTTKLAAQLAIVATLTVSDTPVSRTWNRNPPDAVRPLRGCADLGPLRVGHYLPKWTPG
jgi:hypothetical protein